MALLRSARECCDEVHRLQPEPAGSADTDFSSMHEKVFAPGFFDHLNKTMEPKLDNLGVWWRQRTLALTQRCNEADKEAKRIEEAAAELADEERVDQEMKENAEKEMVALKEVGSNLNRHQIVAGALGRAEPRASRRGGGQRRI